MNRQHGAWAARVLAGLAVPALLATAWSGVAALVLGTLLIGLTLSREVAVAVGPRSRELRRRVLGRLAELRVLRADQVIDSRTHDPFSSVGALLRTYETDEPAAKDALDGLRDVLEDVQLRLVRTDGQRDAWDDDGGLPALVGGLSILDDGEVTVKLYGDPVNVPDWIGSPDVRDGIASVGRVLDDVRQLHSAQVEWLVLTFTLLARALLLVLTPAVGSLTFAVVPVQSSLSLSDAPWLLATAWAVGTALAAPGLATRVMEASPRGARVRRVLLAVELPLSCALALTCPAWTAVAFAAGWTNWWQRIGRHGSDRARIPDFSWARLAIWTAVVVACQAAGLLLDGSALPAWQVLAEIAWTLLVIAIIGGSYGAMLPVSAGMLVRVLFHGVQGQRTSDEDADAVISEIAEAMTRAADALAQGPGDEAAELLRRSTRELLAERGHAAGHGTPRSLPALVIAALAEGGHDMWADDPRALSTRARAEKRGEAPPVIVQRPRFEPSADALASIQLSRRDASTLRQLLVACIVEARVHGLRRVETVVRRDGDRVEVRIANEPGPPSRHRGRGRGGKRIRALARALPRGGEPFRGLTDRSFLDKPGSLTLFGVSFAFSITPKR